LTPAAATSAINASSRWNVLRSRTLAWRRSRFTASHAASSFNPRWINRRKSLEHIAHHVTDTHFEPFLCNQMKLYDAASMNYQSNAFEPFFLDLNGIL
jgi:hypothetical protein